VSSAVQPPDRFSDSAGLRDVARRLTAEISQLLSRPPERRALRARRAARRGAGGNRVAQSPDAEMRKILGRLLAVIDEAERLAALEDSNVSGGSTEDREQGHRLARVAAKLRDLDVDQIGPDSGGEFADQLELALIEAGDRTFLHQQLEFELYLDRNMLTPLTWSSMFGPLDDGTSRDGVKQASELDPVRQQLLDLRYARMTQYRRTGLQLAEKARLLRGLAVGITALVIATAVAAVVASSDPGATWASLYLAAAAGALGAGVSGIYKLRDEIQRARAIREFRAILLAQLAVGMAAGLFVELVLESGLITIAGAQPWAVKGATAFVAGFSEPFFLGTVRRVGASVEAPGDSGPEQSAITPRVAPRRRVRAPTQR
jgi:hypothetical protein